MKKKHIDNLFQEKLKDFGEFPDEHVWKSIEASLDKKKKSRGIVPFWWQLGGVAALLALMLYIINPFEKDSPNTTNITNSDEKIEDAPNTIDSLQQKDIFKTPDSRGNTPLATTPNNQENKPLEEKNTAEPSSYATDDSNKKDAYTNVSKPKNKVQAKINRDTELVTDSKEEKSLKKEKNKEETVPFTLNNGNTAVAGIGPEKEIKEKAKDQRDYNSNEEIQKENTVAGAQKDEMGKKSIFDEIDKQNEEVIAENTPKDRWSAGPSVAPVYFNGIGEGSPVHSIFVPNGKSGNVNLSYGLTVSYEVSKKISIRSGVHRVDYGYNTNDVAFSSSLDGSTNDQIDNISYKATSENLVLRSTVGPNNTADFGVNEDVTATSAIRDGILSQQFGYLEVPLEVNYAIVDKKIGVTVIGGFSSLFLVDNSISVAAESQTMELGEANNINDINFSTNIGMGVSYKFTPKMQLNVEPVFKYQLNTFSNTDGSFQPFSLGIYSGLSFRF